VTGDWRKLHSEDLHKLYSSPVSYHQDDGMVEKINAYKIMVGKPEGKKQFGKPRRRWEDIIKMDFK
jgi:hypothetical protein